MKRFMREIRTELTYLSSQEWARVVEVVTVTVGISDYAQSSLGDVVFVDTPEVGAQLAMVEEAGVVESLKAASDIYSPVSGEVIAVNTDLEEIGRAHV